MKSTKTRARPHGEQEYRGNGKHDWEQVTKGGKFAPVLRLRVPGGWLYSEDGSSSYTFVPMPVAVNYAV